MTDAIAYLATAKKLLKGRPTDADIRRAVSTAYYAMFHHACMHFSTIVLQPESGSYVRAWLQAYRYIDHGPAKQRCLEAVKVDRKFPAGLVAFAERFIELQQRRIEADYDPARSFTAADAQSLIKSAEDAISAFDAEPIEAQRAFVLFVGLRPKNR